MADATPPEEQGDIPIFHRYVGEAIRHWAEIENSLWELVSMLLGVDQFRARIVIESVPIGRPRRQFVERLAETYFDATVLDRFRSLMKRMDKLGLERNLLAHALMHVNVDGQQNMIMRDIFTSETMSGGLDFEFKPFPLNDLRTLVRALIAFKGEFWHFVFECRSGGKIHASARIHRES
jgi:hypothetical protein